MPAVRPPTGRLTPALRPVGQAYTRNPYARPGPYARRGRQEPGPLGSGYAAGDGAGPEGGRRRTYAARLPARNSATTDTPALIHVAPSHWPPK